MPPRPIFIIGSGRSGTTLLYELLSGHPDLAWISNVSERFPRSRLAPAINRFAASGPSAPRRLAIRPSEGYRAFDWATPRFRGASSRPLSRSDLRPAERKRLRGLARRHVVAMKARRFLNKNTRNTRRILFLDEAFPEAQFVHVIRHPHAAVASMLRVDFWPALEHWNRPSASALSAPSRDAVLAARLWLDEVSAARLAAEQLSDRDRRYLEVRYEDLVSAPDESFAEILGFLSLPDGRELCEHTSRFTFFDRNRGIGDRLSHAELQAVSELVYPLAHELGYDV